MGKRWTEAENNIIRENYKTMKDAELVKLLEGRTISGIGEQRYNLGLAGKVRMWTDAEKELIKNNLHLPALELAKFFPNDRYAQINAIRDRVRLSLIAKEAEQAKVTLPNDWKPSYITNEFDEDMKLAVKIQQMLRPYTKGWVRKT